MSGNGLIDHHGRPTAADGAPVPSASPSGTGHFRPSPAGRPRLRLQVIERVAIVRFAACEFLVGETIADEVMGRLEHIVEAKGCPRLLLNLGGVRYTSDALLGRLARLREELDRRGGELRLCGLDPLLRDLLRISGQDRVFDDCADEAEALGLLVR